MGIVPYQTGKERQIFSFRVVHGASYGGKAACAGNDHIVIAAGAVNDEQFAIAIFVANDAHMGIIRVEHQVTGLCVRPRNIGAI